MKKSERELVFQKYGGRCAYCGCELTKGWHVDEIEPVRRIYKTIHSYYVNEKGEVIDMNSDEFNEKWGTDKLTYVPTRTNVFCGYENPENLNIANQNPSCASCNINKHSMSLEDFRNQIARFMKHLNEINTQYKIAKRYGLVVETDKPVIFYFETLQETVPKIDL